LKFKLIFIYLGESPISKIFIFDDRNKIILNKIEIPSEFFIKSLFEFLNYKISLRKKYNQIIKLLTINDNPLNDDLLNKNIYQNYHKMQIYIIYNYFSSLLLNNSNSVNNQNVSSHELLKNIFKKIDIVNCIYQEYD